MRTTAKATILFALLLTTSLLCAAEPPSDLYVIPVATHTPGFLNTMWKTDVAIQNVANIENHIHIYVIESGLNPSGNVYPIDKVNDFLLLHYGNLLISDILKDFRGKSAATGALLIGGDRPFVVSSRTYNQSEEGGPTFGQNVPGIPNFVASGVPDQTEAVTFLPGLMNNTQYRTNFGFVAATPSDATAPLVLELTLRGEVGQRLGTKTYLILPGTNMHTQWPWKHFTNLVGNVNAAGVEARIVSGRGAVVPYASIIDNASGDAVFVTNQVPTGSSDARVAPDAFRQLYDQLRR